MKQPTIVKIVLSALFLICLAPLPYGYYQFVRFLGMVGFGYLAYTKYESKHNNWMIFYISSAVLINPIFKISLGRSLWNILDVLWAIILIATIFSDTKQNKTT